MCHNPMGHGLEDVKPGSHFQVLRKYVPTRDAKITAHKAGIRLQLAAPWWLLWWPAPAAYKGMMPAAVLGVELPPFPSSPLPRLPPPPLLLPPPLPPAAPLAKLLRWAIIFPSRVEVLYSPFSFSPALSCKRAVDAMLG